MAPVRLALTLPVAGQVVGDDLALLVDIARRCEQAGVDTLVVVDHVIMGERTDRYEWGRFAFPHGSPWAEPLTLLAAIAAATSTVRLATGILVAALRGPALLAKTVATLDRLSNGRVDLGVGVGWQPEEYAVQGLDFAHRGRLLDATVEACRQLWGPSPAALTPTTAGGYGAHQGLDRMWCDPKPVQPGGPPLWFAGTLHPANVRRIATVGDGWIPIMGATQQDIAAGVVSLRAARRAVGRGDAPLLVRAPLPLVRSPDGADLGATLRGAAACAEAGVTEVGLPMSVWVRTPDEVDPFLAGLSHAWAATWR